MLEAHRFRCGRNGYLVLQGGLLPGCALQAFIALGRHSISAQDPLRGSRIVGPSTSMSARGGCLSGCISGALAGLFSVGLLAQSLLCATAMRYSNQENGQRKDCFFQFMARPAFPAVQHIKFRRHHASLPPRRGSMVVCLRQCPGCPGLLAGRLPRANSSWPQSMRFRSGTPAQRRTRGSLYRGNIR